MKVRAASCCVCRSFAFGARRLGPSVRWSGEPASRALTRACIAGALAFVLRAFGASEPCARSALAALGRPALTSNLERIQPSTVAARGSA